MLGLWDSDGNFLGNFIENNAYLDPDTQKKKDIQDHVIDYKLIGD